MGLLINLAAVTARLWLAYTAQWPARYTAWRNASRRRAKTASQMHKTIVATTRGEVLVSRSSAGGRRIRAGEDGMRAA